MPAPDPVAVANEIDARICGLEDRSTASVREVRRELSRRVRRWDGDDVLALAHGLLRRHRWVAYELVDDHPSASRLLDDDEVGRLGEGLDGWVAVDTFGRYISGPAWQRHQVSDELIESWTASPDRWWRRAALVSTVPLNLRAAGGTGDADRTLMICRLLVDDRDDMVVKAMSWALRALAVQDAEAARSFLADHDDRIAARARREVSNKLDTGLKNPGRRPAIRRAD